MNVNLNDCQIRFAKPSDKDDLLLVARGIWGGTDYLPKVIDRWISEPWFLVCEYKGKAIACLKMTLFPDNVLWFEGLRVQTKYQNHGIATLMNKHSFALADQIRNENPGISFEFCTYYLNVESLHLTQKIGFRSVEKFFVLDKKGLKATQEPGILKGIDLKHFHNYPRYIPCSWQSVHNSANSIPFLQEHGTLFKTSNATYYLGGLHERCITLLEPPTQAMKKDLPYFQHFFGSRKKYSIILPAAFRTSLDLLFKLGFRFWDDNIEENMLVLRLDKTDLSN